MINILRSKDYDPEINFFHGREWVSCSEVVIKTKKVFGKNYRYVEPSTPGNYAFGGTILYSSNGIFPEFNEPVKLHDRRMDLERR